MKSVHNPGVTTVATLVAEIIYFAKRTNNPNLPIFVWTEDKKLRLFVGKKIGYKHIAYITEIKCNVGPEGK